MIELNDFVPFSKIPRLFREIIVTEKIDGTNATVAIGADGSVRAASRNRWITPEDDNYGFAAWVEVHRNSLRDTLGAGMHRGEWWGSGINRGYGSPRRRFWLFNTRRWCRHDAIPGVIPHPDPKREPEYQQRVPECCGVVPELYRGIFSEAAIEGALQFLRRDGSVAMPGFARPEGVVIWHIAADVRFKVTLESDAAKGSS